MRGHGYSSTDHLSIRDLFAIVTVQCGNISIFALSCLQIKKSSFRRRTTSTGKVYNSS